MTSSETFSACFDAIEIDPARAPSPAAIDAALAACAPQQAPGFYLLDDARGRFVVDRAWGLISLRDEATLERERGQVHPVRLQVVEPSGNMYEITLRLAVDGMVPQLVGSGLAESRPAPQTVWSAYVAFHTAPAGAAHRALSALHFDDSTCVLALPEAPPLALSANAAWAI
jgi:hypothetical protein